MPDDELAPVFIPSLAALLVDLERKKGSPLLEAEVVEIRDKATVIMLTHAQAEHMAAERGYDDIDPENVWAEWQVVRAEVAVGEGEESE